MLETAVFVIFCAGLPLLAIYVHIFYRRSDLSLALFALDVVLSILYAARLTHLQKKREDGQKQEISKLKDRVRELERSSSDKSTRS